MKITKHVIDKLNDEVEAAYLAWKDKPASSQCRAYYERKKHELDESLRKMKVQLCG